MILPILMILTAPIVTLILFLRYKKVKSVIYKQLQEAQGYERHELNRKYAREFLYGFGTYLTFLFSTILSVITIFLTLILVTTRGDSYQRTCFERSVLSKQLEMVNSLDATAGVIDLKYLYNDINNFNKHVERHNRLHDNIFVGIWYSKSIGEIAQIDMRLSE